MILRREIQVFTLSVNTTTVPVAWQVESALFPGFLLLAQRGMNSRHLLVVVLVVHLTGLSTMFLLLAPHRSSVRPLVVPGCSSIRRLRQSSQEQRNEWTKLHRRSHGNCVRCPSDNTGNTQEHCERRYRRRKRFQ